MCYKALCKVRMTNCQEGREGEGKGRRGEGVTDAKGVGITADDCRRERG